MHAAVLHRRDLPPRFETFPDPAPQEGEVPLRVLAAGLHPLVRA